MTLCGLCRTSSTGVHRFPVQIFQALTVQEKPTKWTGNIKGFGVVERFAAWLVGWVQTEPVLLEASCLRGWRRKAGCQRSASWRKYEPQNSSFRAITLATPDHTYYKHCPTAPPSATHQDLSPLSCALTKAGWLKFQD